MSFQYKQFSKKQLQLLTWWQEGSPHKDKNGIIAEGAVRSGKTLLMSLSFVLWAMSKGNNITYAICGKTIGSLERNLIRQLVELLKLRKFKVLRKDNSITVVKNGVKNVFYLFGGRDERSQDLIQGITLGGVLLDEVALMPRSFVEQALARCSVSGSKYWFNCNPEGPTHWFYLEHVLKSEEKDYVRIHFDLTDNPSLDERTIQRYYSMFKGVFYRRFILGEWTAADGVIYDCFREEVNTYSNSNDIPWQVREGYNLPIYSCDYGIFNKQVYLRGNYFENVLYITGEWSYDGREKMYQLTDVEYVEAFKKFNNGQRFKGLVIDPSASSLIVAMNRANVITYKANNEVLPGIRAVYNLMAQGRIKISKSCIGLLKELGMYVWDSKRADKMGEDHPLKVNDHFCDALRYMVTFIVPDFKNYVEAPGRDN